MGSPVGSPGIPCIPESFAVPLDGIPQTRLFTRDPGAGRLTYIRLPVNDQGACRGIPRLFCQSHCRGGGGVALLIFTEAAWDLTRSLQEYPQYKCTPCLVTYVPTLFHLLCGVLDLRSRCTVNANPANRKLVVFLFLVVGTRNKAEKCPRRNVTQCLRRDLVPKIGHRSCP